MIKFVDLFAGIGGMRLGFEQACKKMQINAECVFTSEIKDSAIKVYKNNFAGSTISGDITKISPDDIPDFDYLLAGFPCQPFSVAGKRRGFLDKRGELFFTIFNVLKTKKPAGFILENVDGLATHDNGNTLKTMIRKLKRLGFNVTWKILDASEFGVPQKRKRIYIVGHKSFHPRLDDFTSKFTPIGKHIDHTAPVEETHFTKLLSKKFSHLDLEGKFIRDKRGGCNNIHSWDFNAKGRVTNTQKNILNLLLKKRRYKKWCQAKGIDWMDGMPLTLKEIRTFYNHPKLTSDLKYLVKKNYLRFEHPKKKIKTKSGVAKRVANLDAPKGYNIVTGKLSFPLTTILDPKKPCPTIVATEAGKIGISTKKGVRPITINEGLLFSGFPKRFRINDLSYQKSFDLLGNTVAPSVIKAITLNILNDQHA